MRVGRLEMPDIDQIPLHYAADHFVSPNLWWGCKEPERPFDIFERWDHRCPKCRIKMRAVLEAGHAYGLIQFTPNGTGGAIDLNGLALLLADLEDL